MHTIELSINMDKEDSQEAKRLFVHAIEKINQKGGVLGSVQQDKMNHLVREFNKGKLKIESLQTALDFVVNEALRMAS